MTKKTGWLLVQTGAARDDFPAAVWLREKDVAAAFEHGGRWFVTSPGGAWCPREVLETSDTAPWRDVR